MLERTKQAVLDMKATLDAAGVANQDAALRQAAGQAFHNTSKFTLRDLRAPARRQQSGPTSWTTSTGSRSPVQDILDNFEFRNHILRLDQADALGSLIEKLTAPDVNLGPDPVIETDGAIRHPGLDNHGFTAATCFNVMYFLPDDGAKQSLLCDIAHRLAPGAPLLLFELHGDRSGPRFDELFAAWTQV